MKDLFTQSVELTPAPPHERMLLLTNAFVISQCIFAVTQLGIADRLEQGAISCNELARQTGTHRATLYRLLRLLVDIDIFAEDEPGVFRNTQMSECLQDKNGFGFIRNFVLLRVEEVTPWTNLLHSIRTGESAFEQMYGVPRYHYLRQNPETNRLFDRAMMDLATIHNTAVAAAYNFSGVRKLIDLAGEQGGLLASVLEKHPNMQGLLFDQAGAIEKARQFLQPRNVLERCELMSGDFFESIPTDGDLYVLKHVLHNWNDRQATQILQNCRRAMRGTEKLLVIERVVEFSSSLRGKMLDLNMLVMFTSGKVRKQKEFDSLLQASGFQMQRLIPTESELCIIEAIPV